MDLAAMLSLLQWPGMALGLIGALCVASLRCEVRRLGFGLWIVSNACWIGNAIGSHTWGLLIMQACFLATSALGWWQNRPRAVSPAVAEGAQHG